MFLDYELDVIEMRNRGNPDVARLLSYVKHAQRTGLASSRPLDWRAIDTSQPELLRRKASDDRIL